MKKLFFITVVAGLALSLAGCGTFSGVGPVGHSSKVTLSGKNFTVVQSNVVGSATVTVLFPLQVPFFDIQMGLPLGDANLYNKAMADLRNKIGGLKDNMGLVNVTVDERLYHFVVIGWKTVTITADVVQFQ